MLYLQSNNEKHKLIKLRNLWGDWSDNSPLWHENLDIRRKLFKEKVNRRDGVFWTLFESFVKYFECVDTCKIRPDWY
ncbi:unnamed protein product [Rotaria sp. Silwood1]|nr:unnamed protein product [Rotaria sp. Silwood1]